MRVCMDKRLILGLTQVCLCRSMAFLRLCLSAIVMDVSGISTSDASAAASLPILPRPFHVLRGLVRIQLMLLLSQALSPYNHCISSLCWAMSPLSFNPCRKSLGLELWQWCESVTVGTTRVATSLGFLTSFAHNLCSDGTQAAIQIQHRVVSIFIAQQKHDGVGDLFGCAEPPQRNLVLQVLSRPSLNTWQMSVRESDHKGTALPTRQHGRVYISRHDHIGAKWWHCILVFPGQSCGFEGQSACKCDQSRFARGICSRSVATFHSKERRDIHDAPRCAGHKGQISLIRGRSAGFLFQLVGHD